MKAITEMIVGITGLFSVGVAGGLERGYVGIAGALIAWACAAVVIAVAVKVRGKA